MGNETKTWSFGVEKDGDLVKMVIPSPFDKTKKECFYPEEVSAFVLRKMLEEFLRR